MMKTKATTLSRLSDSASSLVLSSLLKEQPKLARKAEKVTQILLKDISIEDMADDVKMALQTIDDFDNLNERAGSRSWGYVEPSEAAAELCEKAVEEFFDDMKRRLELGDIAGAAPIL
jgi:hypothetical protein